jgi:hypothetical protein
MRYLLYQQGALIGVFTCREFAEQAIDVTIRMYRCEYQYDLTIDDFSIVEVQ